MVTVFALEAGMETFDFRGEQMIPTAAGVVTLTTAGHDDGSVSVSAWLMATGQRVGQGRGYPNGRRRDEILVDSVVAGADIGVAMRSLLDLALGRAPRDEPIGQQLIRAGRLSQADVSDLLGWQWLLAELGQPRRLGDLALAAGFLGAATGALADDPGQGHAPGPATTARAAVADERAVVAGLV